MFTPVLAKHSKSFSLIDCISVGVDRMQRNFEPMRKQVEAWQRSELTDVTAKVVIYEAFVEGRLEAQVTSGGAHETFPSRRDQRPFVPAGPGINAFVCNLVQPKAQGIFSRRESRGLHPPTCLRLGAPQSLWEPV